MDKLLLHPQTQASLQRIIGHPGHHALGVVGGDGSGKKYLANFIASRIMKSADISANPYVKIIDCNDKVGIDEVRGSIKFLSLKIPGDETYKRCLIFYSFENLSIEGQNSLLKSLEEPPADTLIILTAESKSRLLPTIVSRTTWLNILPVGKDAAIKFFEDEYDKEKILNALTIADGRVGLTRGLLDDYENHPYVKSINKAKEIIAMDRFERLNALDSITKSDEADTSLYLWAMAKVLNAAMKNRLAKTGTVNRNMLASLKLVASAQNAQKYNVNQKALLTELFYKL